MNRQEMAGVLGVLVAAHPGVNVTSQTADVWLAEFEGVPVEVAQRAARMCLREHDRFPSIATFLTYVRAATPRRESRELVAAPSGLSAEQHAEFIALCRDAVKHARELPE